MRPNRRDFRAGVLWWVGRPWWCCCAHGSTSLGKCLLTSARLADCFRRNNFSSFKLRKRTSGSGCVPRTFWGQQWVDKSAMICRPRLEMRHAVAKNAPFWVRCECLYNEISSADPYLYAVNGLDLMANIGRAFSSVGDSGDFKFLLIRTSRPPWDRIWPRGALGCSPRREPLP